MKIWKRSINSVIALTIIYVIATGILAFTIAGPASTTAYTTRADCTHAMKIHDKEARRLMDKIDEQGELIGAYKDRRRNMQGIYELR